MRRLRRAIGTARSQGHRYGGMAAVVFALQLVACNGSNNDTRPPPDDDYSAPIITRDSYTTLVAHVFDIYVGDLYKRPLLDIISLQPLSIPPVSVEQRNGVYYGSYDCSSGHADSEFRPSSTNYGELFVYQFDACLDAGVLRNGTVNGRHGGYTSDISTDALTLQIHPELVTRFSGSATIQYSDSRIGPLHAWETRNLSLDSRSIDGDISLESATHRFSFDTSKGPNDYAALSGDFSVRSDITDGKSLSVSTPVDFAYHWNRTEPPESSGGQLTDRDGIDDPPWSESDGTQEMRNHWFFSTGRLDVIAEDGSRLLLDADTSVPDTVRITIDNDDGTDVFETSWLPWQHLLRFDRYPADQLAWVYPASHANPDPDAGPSITPTNYRALLDEVFDVFSGRDTLAPLAITQDFLSSNEPVQTNRERGVRSDRFDCPGDGAVSARRIDVDTSAYPQDFRLAFTGCEVDGYRLDGEVHGQENRLHGGVRWLESDELVWLDNAGKQYRFNGNVSHRRPGDDADKPSSTANDASLCVWSVTYANISSPDKDPVNVLSSDGMQFETSDGSDDRDEVLLSGGFQIVSPATGGHMLSVTADTLTTTPVTVDGIAMNSIPDGGFAAGHLYLQADDGARLFLNVVPDEGGGAPLTQIVIDNRDGRHESIEPWTSWRARSPDARTRVCGNGEV